MFETACIIDEDVELHPFAFRTHAHRHGVKVISYNLDFYFFSLNIQVSYFSNSWQREGNEKMSMSTNQKSFVIKTFS